MGCIDKHLRRINKSVFIAFFEYARKYLFKEIRIFESAGIVFPKCREIDHAVEKKKKKEEQCADEC